MKVANLKSPFVIAHRGATFYEPENTLSSVRKALELGSDAIEVDVRLSKDGYLILMHDPVVDRVTDGKGKVKDMNLQELRKLKVQDKERVALLDDVLTIVKGRSVLVVDVKDPDATLNVLNVIRKNKMVDCTIFNSSSLDVLKKIRKLEPKAYLSYAYMISKNVLEVIKEVMPFMITTHYSLVDKKMLEMIHKFGVRVIAWGTNDLSTLKDLIAQGLDGIIIDKPDMMRSIKPTAGAPVVRKG